MLDEFDVGAVSDANGAANDRTAELLRAMSTAGRGLHLRFPIAHRRVIRTTNLLERLFGEERRRMKIVSNGCQIGLAGNDWFWI